MLAKNLARAQELNAKFQLLAQCQAALDSIDTMIVIVNGFHMGLTDAARARVANVLRQTLAEDHAKCAAQALEIGLDFE